MKPLKQIVPVFLLFLFAACGGESAEYAESAAAEEPMMEEAAEEPMEEAAETYSGPNAELIAEFDASAVVLMAAMDGVSGDQWTFRESDDRWSIGEVCEHIVISEVALIAWITELTSGEPSAEPAEANAEADDGVRAMIRDRSDPVQTSEEFEPKGVYATPEDAIVAFNEMRERTKEFLMTSDVDFRAYSGTLNEEVIPPMDAHKWLLFVAGHVERHSAQIDQVKADEAYPTG